MKLFFAFAIIAVALTVVYGAPDPWNEYKVIFLGLPFLLAISIHHFPISS
jgi:hypothetical protein